MSSALLEDSVGALFESAGVTGAPAFRPMTGGANNRVFRVTLPGRTLLLKAYFRHPGDPRDRLRTEFAFSRFAWRYGVRTLPEPLACDPERGLGLYEFVEGERIEPGGVDAGAVDQAVAFFDELNRHRGTPEAVSLPDGSEACFSIREHLRCVEWRVRRLSQVVPSSDVDHDAVDFIRGTLESAWARVSETTIRIAGRDAIGVDAPVPAGQRRLSPSDFGFHNALREPSGRLRFFDFEYAGWDDPAKTVCDFFCQPAVPVPLDYLPRFLESVVSGAAEPGCRAATARIALLLPVYRLKWCCILLNDFLPVDSARRRFADGEADRESHKAAQLRKARRSLADLT